MVKGYVGNLLRQSLRPASKSKLGPGTEGLDNLIQNQTSLGGKLKKLDTFRDRKA